MSNLELNCQWHFPLLPKNGYDAGPNDPMQQNFKKTPYASLIRESIQNSLDVVADETKPVRMEYAISRIQSCDYTNFFTLRDHIQGCIDYYHANTKAKTIYQPMVDYFDQMSHVRKVAYIKVSDANTTGMQYVKGDNSNPFYAFVRAAGVSTKTDEGAGGSFGFGKAAYFNISPLRTIFVSTMTSQRQRFFEGVASLCTHTLPDTGEKYMAVGYYDNNDGEPTSKAEHIPERFARNEPGTDIYILGIDATNRASIYKEMIEAVLRNFWLAILRGKLEVRVGDTDITAVNIANLMEQYFPDEHDTKRKEANYNPRPYLEAVAHAGEDDRHIAIKETWGKLGKVEFYALKSKYATDKILYMRRPLMLVKARRTEGSNGFYGVFVCADRYTNETLRQTENPAHNEWSSKNWQDDKGRVMPEGKEVLDELERYKTDIVQRLFASAHDDVQQIKGLDDFLYIPTAVEDDDEAISEALVGDPIDQHNDDEEHPALSTDLGDGHQTPSDSRQATGKVIIDTFTDTPQHPDPLGKRLSGHGTQKKKRKGGGGASPGRLVGHYGDSADGIDGTFLTELPVGYRAFAQSEDGETAHVIVIHADRDIENGRIDLLVGGEQSDDKVTIRSCTPQAVIHENTLSGLTLRAGRNVIKVRFADNMKHAVKLDAYERK